MNRVDRIYKIHELLRNARRPVPMSAFIGLLESSRNSVTRDFEYLRNILGAPLEYCRDQNGHRYDPNAPVFELPGFWMNQSELYALLACEQLLEQVQPGLITNRLAPLKDRIRILLGQSGHAAELVSQKIRIQPFQVRESIASLFDPVAQATLSGKQLCFDYTPRSNGSPGQRITHPQRLIHYRSNWYLAALCTKANSLRLFSIDRINAPHVLEAESEIVDDVQLNAFLSSGFGIFGGMAQHTAELRFSHHAARWVASEQWHPQQIGEWRNDGYHLSLPYSDSLELVMDILRYGEDVEVIAPPALREQVALRIIKMHKIYW